MTSRLSVLALKGLGLCSGERDQRKNWKLAWFSSSNARRSNMKWKIFSPMLMLLLIALAGCDGSAIPTSGAHTFSFERDMEEWVANGTDLDNPPVEWSIERSDDIASDGKQTQDNRSNQSCEANDMIVDLFC